MTRRARFAVGGFLVCSSLVVFLLPFSLMLLPNPAPKRVTDMTAEPTGVYLVVAGATYHVFPHAELQQAFPTEAAVARPDSTLLVKYRNLADPSLYAVHVFPGGAEVPLGRDDRASDHVLALKPRALPPGRYYLTTQREGMYGGTDYVYFRVASPAR
jgi:hypothetical protein